MDNLSWRILEILKKNANGELSNSEYIARVNECIYEMIRMQPFSDGNKRTSRLLSNILYQEKGIPYVIIPVKDWDNYVNAWSKNTIEDYNSMMNRLVIDSYKYFYGNQSANDAAFNKVTGQKIITNNSSCLLFSFDKYIFICYNYFRYIFYCAIFVFGEGPWQAMKRKTC